MIEYNVIETQRNNEINNTVKATFKDLCNANKFASELAKKTGENANQSYHKNEQKDALEVENITVEMVTTTEKTTQINILEVYPIAITEEDEEDY